MPSQETAILVALAGLAAAAGSAQADPVTDSGTIQPGCATVSACLMRGYVLRTTTTYATRSADGTEWITIAHFLQDGTRLVACSVSFPASDSTTGRGAEPLSRCVAPDW